jgi:hypothetical protein
MDNRVRPSASKVICNACVAAVVLLVIDDKNHVIAVMWMPLRSICQATPK